MEHLVYTSSGNSGSTWFGSVFDAHPETKYIWESDLGSLFSTKNARNAPNLNDFAESWENRPRMKQHVFEKRGEPKYCVWKLGSAVTPSYDGKTWRNRTMTFWQVHRELTPKLVHLVRHPARRFASMLRWSTLKRSTDLLNEGSIGNTRLFKHRGEPWYKLVRWEDAVLRPMETFGSICEFWGIDFCDEMRKFLGSCHENDESDNLRDHPITMTVETVMNRWKALEPEELEMANADVEQNWKGVYEPL